MIVVRRKMKGSNLDRKSQYVWDNECFTLDLYSIGNEELTAAEAVLRWMRDGYDWETSLRYLQSFGSIGRKRDVPLDSKRARRSVNTELAKARIIAAQEEKEKAEARAKAKAEAEAKTRQEPRP